MFQGSSQLAFHLVFDRFVEEPKLLSAALMDQFQVRRLVFIKKSPKEKWLLKSAVLILESGKSLELLRRGELALCGVRMEARRLSLEDAEDLIEQKRTKIYVGNIPYPVDNLMLWNHFSQFGKIDYSYILKKPVLRGAKGFGFVIYENRASVERALAQKNILHGAKLNCKLFLNKAKLKRDLPSAGFGTDTGRELDLDNLADQDPMFEHQDYQQIFGCLPADLDEKVSKLSRDSTDKCGSGAGQNHQDLDHCKDCCDECHEVAPENGQVSVARAGSSRLDQHVSRHIEDEEHELPEIIPGSQFINMFSEPTEAEPVKPQASGLKSQVAPVPKRRTLKEAMQMRRDRETRTSAPEPEKLDTKDSTAKNSRDTCECRSNSCEKCWKDLIDNEDYNPPCDVCICDLKSAGAIGQIASKLARKKVVSPPLHPVDECKDRDCEPCSSLYAQLKKALKRSCCEYSLFDSTK